MTFREVEDILGFSLPKSARDHQAWWSNARQGHSHAAAWLDAGWRTANLDLSGETVTFVKGSLTSLAEEGAVFQRRSSRSLSINLDHLTPMGRKLVEDYAQQHGADLGRAVTSLLNEVAYQRRAAMLDWFALTLPPTGLDSVDLIREDRDAR
jgi:hypothetical protein